MEKLRGIIFDLDGTLVDSKLDFDRMRAEIGMPAGQPILEYIERLPSGLAKTAAQAVVVRHEFEGARVATLMAGVSELLVELERRRIRVAILTRNMRAPTALTLERLGLNTFAPVITREDAPAKPDPAGYHSICAQWACSPSQTLMIGDYRFDLETAKNAGAKSLLYWPQGEPWPTFHTVAAAVISSFAELTAQFDRVVYDKLGFAPY